MVKSNRKSFTLIETLIVATIIVLLSGTSLAIFSTYRDDKALSNQVTQLTSILELAKNKATSADVSLCSGSSSAHVNGYSVVISTSLGISKITLLAGCPSPTPIVYPIPTNITYVSPSLPYSLQFDNQNYQGGTQKFIIKNGDTTKCKFVQIDETGVVTNGDIACP